MNDVIISTKERSVFHEEYCPYVKRISKKYRKQIPEELARKKGYCECKFCRSVKGIVYKYRHRITGLSISYDPVDDAMCVRTQIGFWKMIWRDNIEKWQLFHMNRTGLDCYDPKLKTKELMRGSFHRQFDCISTCDAESILEYIKSHDRNYEIVEQGGVNKLPKNTPKQKLHYRQAKNKKRKEEIKNVFKIFKTLEKERER